MILSRLCVCLITWLLVSQAFAQGFVEEQATNYRTRLTAGDISGFMPANGLTKFTFPAPYSTTAWRITDSGDCSGATDCVQASYAYWYKLNAHQNSNTMRILVHLDKANGGDGPHLFLLNKTTEVMTDGGPLWSAGNPLSDSNYVYQWYWSLTQESSLYLIENGSTALKRLNVSTMALTTVVDLAVKVGAGVKMWQAHSSADDVHHAGTVCEDDGGVCDGSSTTNFLKCWYYNSSTDTFRQYDRIGTAGSFDECHLSKDGRYTVMTDVVDSKPNQRIFDNTTGSLVHTLTYQSNGALSHLDTGYSYMVGPQSFQSGSAPDRAASVHVFSFPSTQGGEIFFNEDFTTHYLHQLLYTSHANARSTGPLSEQMTCGNNAQDSSGTFELELTCVRLDSSFEQLIVAPFMSETTAGKGDGGRGDPSYYAKPHLSIDVTGKYAIWTSNLRGSRLDAFLVKIPSTLLVPDLPAPEPPPEPAGVGSWICQPYQTVTDRDGNLVPQGAVLHVYQVASTTYATIYADAGCATTKPNPVTYTAGSWPTAGWSFFARSGVYDLVFSFAGARFSNFYGVSLVGPASTTFAALGDASNGISLYCADCTFANPCASGGTGAIAKRLNGSWRCD